MAIWRYILYKAGTVKELSRFEEVMDHDLYSAALNIVKILDCEYGADRDVDQGDGGFVLIAENVQDLEVINRRYKDLNGSAYEAVDVVKCESGVYINAFFLHNNEFGVNVLMPIEIAPEAILRDLRKEFSQQR
jgi:hypothetical protein